MLLSYKPLHLEAQQRLQEEGCVVDINKHHVWVGPIFVHYLMGKDSNTIASIHHLFKTVPIQVAQHLKAHCTIMWMKACSDLS